MQRKTRAQKLNDVWRSGYCEETVEAGRRFATDAAKRVAFLQEHVGSCDVCQFANIMKNVEHRTAIAVGVEDAFHAGEDVHRSPGFSQALKEQVSELLNNPDLDPRFIVWWGGVALRQDYEKERSKSEDEKVKSDE